MSEDAEPVDHLDALVTQLEARADAFATILPNLKHAFIRVTVTIEEPEYLCQISPGNGLITRIANLGLALNFDIYNFAGTDEGREPPINFK